MPKESRKLHIPAITPYRGGASDRKKFKCPVCPNCSLDWVLAKDEVPATNPSDEDAGDLVDDAQSEFKGEFDEFDDFFDDVGDFGDEDAYEGVATSLKPGETFLDHIHFGDPEDEIWDEGWSVSDGNVHYWRTTSSGRTYEYRGLLGETDVDSLIGRLRSL